MQDLENRLETLETALLSVWTKLGLDQKSKTLKNLEQEIAEPELWHHPETAKAKNLEFARLSEELGPWQLLKTQTDDLHELLALNSTDLGPEITDQLTAMENTYQTLKKALRFTGPYDHKNAILRITAGVGGTEAMDWSGMLERMYLRFAEQNHLKVTVLERTTGEETGIKTAVYEITGANVYGTLKSEHGVHRLVRLSPFNANNLRQTSFALIEVLPVIKTDTSVLDRKSVV